ncbi:xylulose kinase [Tetragenococcus halophilus subsp. flandriensis]|uniref:xylulokinase n=1 Tax=Tetragenococcus halophilus TaxID=51669 RepID=UPI0023E966F3|nr:xylulokinase [Tetragenococcus halophilus]GMA08037.1 xylulose kinase [Tetragenococcus halophilus subsp. flandriensis]
MSYYIGVDLGTSSIKMVLANEHGEILGSTNSQFTIISDKINHSEQSPKEWLYGFDQAFTEMVKKYPETKKQLKAISFSGQMHSLVLIDKNGHPIRNAILWNDTRTTDQVQKLKTEVGQHLLEIEKNIPLEGFTLPKVLWVMEYDKKSWEKTWKFMMPKDYLIYYLTGQIYTERSDASGTIMYDIENHCWDTELLSKYGIMEEQCPEILNSTETAGVFQEKIKEKYGLTNNVQVVMGGADNACGALGIIDDKESQGMLSVGTSGVVFCYSNHTDESIGNYHYFNSLIEGQNYKMGVTLSAAYSLEWYKENFSSAENFSELTNQAKQSSIGSNGLLFLPYLFGERSPYYNSNMAAEFFGIKAIHKKGDFVRSIMEGIAFSLRNVYERMELTDSDIKDKFRITGGVVKNPYWLQIFADIFNSDIEILEIDEGPALGALICAVYATTNKNYGEIWQEFNQIKKCISLIRKLRKYMIVILKNLRV